MGASGLSAAVRGATDVAQASSVAHLESSLAVRPPADVGKSFESLLATMLVKEMRKALPDGFFGQGTDGDVYGGWLDETIGEAVAKSGALQISRKVHESLESKAAEPATIGATT